MVQRLPSFRTLPLALALQAALSNPVWAASFTVADGATDNTAKSLAGGGTGLVGTGATLTTSGTTVTVTVNAGTSTLTNSGTISQTGTANAVNTGAASASLTINNNAGATISAVGAATINFGHNGTFVINNSGTISQIGTGIAISTPNGTPNLTINNEAGAVISSAGGGGSSVLFFDRVAGSYYLNNQGAIWQKNTVPGTSSATSRAIVADKNYSTFNNRIVNGSPTNSAAIIRADANDAIRLGTNVTLTNYGSIFSTGVVNTSWAGGTGQYLAGIATANFQAADGVAIENGRSNVTILNYGSITGPRHGIDGGDPIASAANAHLTALATTSLANASPTDWANLISIDRLEIAGINTADTAGTVSFNRIIDGVTTNIRINNPVIVNYAGGVITGNNGSGVGIDGHAVVINYGAISGNYAGAGNVYSHAVNAPTVTVNGETISTSTSSNGDGDGVDIDGVAYIENWGSIRGTGAGGYDSGGRPNGADGIAAGGGTIINRAGAVIYGQSKGILIDDGANGTLTNPAAATARNTSTTTGSAARIFNAGTITGEKKTAVGLVGDYADLLVNYDSGVITGGAESTLVDALASATPGAAVQMGGGNDILINYGRIEGKNGLAIDMGAGNDTVKLFGGTVIGAIVGGAGIDTLETRGTHRFASGTLSGFESFIVRDGGTVFDYGLGNVVSVQVDAGASLQINGGVSVSGNMTIDGTFKASSVTMPRLISVDGNLSMGAASVVEMGLGASNTSDKFQVSGVATLNPGAAIRPIPRGYVANGVYTLVQGGVSGTAPGLAADADTATVRYALSVGGGNLLLTATRNPMNSLSSSDTAGMAAALEALGQTGSSAADPMLAALDSLPSATAVRDALKQIAPDTSGSVLAAAQLATGTMFSAFGQRIDAARSGAFSQAGRGLSAGETMDRRIWLEALGAWGKQNPRGDSTGYRIGAGGLALGFEVDRSVREVMGISAGYTQASTNGIESAHGDDVRVNGYHLGGYLSRTDKSMTLDASLVLGYNDYGSQRRVVFPGFSETVRGDFSGWHVGGRVEYGFPLGLTVGWSGRWLIGARAGYLSTKGYTEKGNPAAAQRVESKDAKSLQSVLGVELARQLSDVSQLQLRARYLREFADAPDVRASFAAGGPGFVVASVKPNRDSLQLGASYRKVTGQGVTIGIGYDAEIKEKYRAHQLTARAVWNF